MLTALLPWGFDLSLNASYTHAKFLEDSAISGYPAASDIPDTPKVSGSAVLQWEHSLRGDSSLFSTLEEDYTGARTDLPFGVTATLITMDQLLVHMPGYSITNFRVGVRGERASGDRWSAALFVSNLTNKNVLLDPQPQITLQTPAFARYVISRRLTGGIDVSYSFR